MLCVSHCRRAPPTEQSPLLSRSPRGGRVPAVRLLARRNSRTALAIDSEYNLVQLELNDIPKAGGRTANYSSSGGRISTANGNYSAIPISDIGSDIP